MKKICFFSCLIFLLINLSSEFLGEELIFIYSWPKISLAGHWEMIIDPYDVGESYGFYKVDRPLERLERKEYQFIPQNYLQVPGDWNTQRRELFFMKAQSGTGRNSFFLTKKMIRKEKESFPDFLFVLARLIIEQMFGSTGKNWVIIKVALFLLILKLLINYEKERIF